jgi:hypothetical protein
MARVILAIMAAAMLGYLGYSQMYGKGRAVGDATPKERLDNVKKAANRIEANDQQRADDALKKADGESQ